jgi:hypothetical protein
MASQKAVEVTKLDASPRTLLEVGSGVGKKRVFMDTVAVNVTDFDADGDILYMAEVPSNAKITSIKLFNDDLDSGTTSVANVGIYNGGTKFTSSTPTTYAADGLIDEDAYATAITTLQAANTSGVEMAFEARNINAVANYVWEDCGLPEDPRVPLRIALTQTATVAGDQAGDVTLIVEYVVE